jgi:hypothetical protein
MLGGHRYGTSTLGNHFNSLVGFSIPSNTLRSVATSTCFNAVLTHGHLEYTNNPNMGYFVPKNVIP